MAKVPLSPNALMARWAAHRLKRAPQRIGCEHPTPYNITTISDRGIRWTCIGCRAEWMELERR